MPSPMLLCESDSQERVGPKSESLADDVHIASIHRAGFPPSLPAGTPHRSCQGIQTGIGARNAVTFVVMVAPRIRVENGRIKLDEPTDLPNGTELYLVSADQFEDVVLLRDDGLSNEEREELLQAIDESLAEAEAGNVEDFSKLISAMRQQP